jgi:hypothetical protein
MNEDSAVGLTFMTKVRANRKMQTHRVPIDGKRLNKVLNRLIRVIGEKELQSILD